MHFHGAYYSNYSAWLISPKNTLPSAHIVWPIVGQELFNMDLGSYYTGKVISSGLFHLWLSEGIMCQTNLKLASSAGLLLSSLCLVGGFIHFHISFLTNTIVRKLVNITLHHIFILIGLGLLSWSAHIIHIALPLNKLLTSGMSNNILPYPHDLLFLSTLSNIFPGFSSSVLVDFNVFLPYSGSSLLGLNLDTVVGAIPLAASAAHHYYLAISFILAALCLRNLKLIAPSKSVFIDLSNLTSNLQLSLSLVLFSSASMLFAHHSYAVPVYPFLSIDYTTLFSLFCHHINIASLLILGAGTHASIYLVRDYYSATALQGTLTEIISHRCIIMGHLIYASIFVGLHSFGLYTHNDTIQALGRTDDMFSDNAIQLKPVFAIWIQSLGLVNIDLSTLNSKVIAMTQELGTADFMVHHIHAFNIHVTLLIMLKGVLYSRTSRLISDKVELGWRYPCDGPGRGGTCQVSPYDHVYLAAFWVYNTISITVFHYAWKMQSDVWGYFKNGTLTHISNGDFSVNSTTINGWLRNFLWSESSQVIQAYGTSLSSYGLVFLLSHFTWALSLMFLYSGRGYWQELIESIIFSHHKLGVITGIQPRALSISQGRSVGLTHYLLGGLGCTFSFLLSRFITLS